MLDLNQNEENILSIQEDSVIEMVVHGELHRFRPKQNEDDSWDLACTDIVDGIYGLSCENIKELKAMLLVDYENGLISKVAFL